MAEVEPQWPPQPKGLGESLMGSIKVTCAAAELVLKGEDMHALRETKVANEPLTIALIADGHGGKAAAHYCRGHVIDAMLAAMGNGPPTGKKVREVGRKAFMAAHDAVLADTSTTAGCTLTVVVMNIARHEATILHAGDSVARLMPHVSASVGLCEDHRIETSCAERERLSRQGGQIARALGQSGKPAGPLRLWPGGVAQARAIGDRDVGAFIDPHPYTRTIKLPESESCCIVACSDGVWDALLPTAVDSLARKGMGNEATLIAQSIVDASLRQRHAYSSEGDATPRDDTTCVVIKVEHEDDPIQSREGSEGGFCCATGGRAPRAHSPSPTRAPLSSACSAAPTETADF